MASEDRSPRLGWGEDGVPVSGRFGDVYFSREDELAESRAVFLQGCGLPQAWAGRGRFVVGELGFGTGLNLCALVQMWRRNRPDEGRLHVFSVEGFPLAAEEARRALAHFPEVAEEAEALLRAWPPAVPGFHRLDLPSEWGVTLDLAVQPVETALSRWTGRADAWFLDGFSPAGNPEMWSEAVLGAVAARSAPGARAATFTVAGSVRRGLQAQGFAVAKRPGHGRKRERLEAVAPGAPAPAAQAPRVAVIGAGVAGAALARALAAAGARPLLVEAASPGAGGSGFPAALVTPRLDAGDPGLAELFAQALRRAHDLYSATEGAVLARGVIQLEQAERDAARFDRIAAQSVWDQGAMRRLDEREAAAALGESVAGGALRMGGALAVRPAAVLSAWLAGIETRIAEVAALHRTTDGVTLVDAGGARIAEVDQVVLAAGWGSAALAPALGLRPVMGQAEWVEGPTTAPVAWGGYAVPTGRGLLFGATHDRDRTDVEVSDEATTRNLETLRARLPGLADRAAAAEVRGRRAAVRATSADRLPLAGALSERVFVLGGLGSRGFALAPLLAEHVAALITGAPWPLPADLAARIDPVRLAERSASRDR